MLALFISCATFFSQVLWALPGGYIIETHHDHDPAALMQELAGRAKIRLFLNYTLFSGVSIQFHNVSSAAEEARGLAEMAGIKDIWPTSVIDVDDGKAVIVPDPQGNASVRARRWALPWDRNRPYLPHVMTQVDRLQAKGITGKGLKIAIVDSGIDYKHPLLGRCFGERCLVSFGTDLVGDFYTGRHDTPIRDDDPMDCNGHGTHVAGIVAARQNSLGFVGAAPGVRLGAYRVMGCKGSVSNDILIAAFLEAFQDGADIITMSISQPRGWQERPLSAVVQRIARQGVPCVLSAGNEARRGQFSASALANGHHAVSVTSFDGLADPVLQIQATYWADNTGSPRQQPGCFGALARIPSLTCVPARSKPLSFTSVIGIPGAWGVSLQVYATSIDPIIGDDACDALPDSVPDLSNLIVLVHDGGCEHVRKAKNIAKKGAKYMILWGEDDENVKPPGGEDCNEIVKAIARVPSTIGQTWTRLVAGGVKVVAQIPDARRGGKVVNKENKATGGAVNSLSTWGPTFDLELEPQFGAPGEHILSTYPRALGGFAILSGASMACPLVAAVYALVYEARQGRTNPFYIQDLLSSTAKPAMLNLGGRFHDYIAPISQQGSGLLQAYNAAYATTLVSPSSLSFNDSDHAPTSLKFTITNKSRAAIKYTLGNKPSVTVYTLPKDSIYPMRHHDDLFATYASLSFTWRGAPVRRFTLQSGQRAIIDVKAQPPRFLEKTRLPLWSGFITIDGTDGSSYSVAYLGLFGSLGNAVVLAPDQAWIFTPKHGNTYPREPDDTTFVIPASGNANDNGDATYPAVHVKLALGTPLLHAYIVPLQGEDELEPIGQHAIFPKRWVDRGVDWEKWDGKLSTGTYAPPGRYKIRIKALRIFGNPSREGDWDTATTQPFTLQYK